VSAAAAESESSTDATPPSSQASKQPAAGFLRHAAVYGVGAVAIQMVSILLLPLYARWLTPAEYGVLQLLYRVGDVLNICLMVGGIQLAAINFWGKASSDRERRHVAATIAWLTGVVLIASLVVMMLCSQTLARQLNLYDDYANAGQLLAFGIFAMMLQATTVMPLALMQARMESTAYLFASISIAVSQLATVAIALVVFDAGVWGVIIAMASTFAVFGILLTIREFSKSSPVPDMQLLWKIVAFSLPFIPSGLFFFVLHSGDQFFLINYYDAATLGIYALAYRVAKGVTTFASGPLMQVWTAKMYDVHRQPDRSFEFGKIYSRILLGFVLGGVAVVMFQDEALALLSSDKFVDSASLIAPLILAHYFLIFANLMDGAFYVERRTDMKPWIAAASTVVMLLAYWMLIPRYAATGAAWASLIGFVFHWGITTVLAQRVFFVKLEYWRIGASLAAAIAVAVCGRQIADQTMLKALLFFLLLAAFWLSGIISSEEKQTVFRLINRGWIGRIRFR